MKSRIILLITAAWIGWLSSALAEVQGTVSVANIAGLQALSIANVEALENTTTNASSTNLTVIVLGYYTPGDRGGGIFEWEANQGATPDGGRYIATNGWSSGNGRWVRQLNGEVANVKMWGAQGNVVGGETPSIIAAAHDDTTNIQNAINACSGDFWATELLFPAGAYKVTDTLYFGDLVRLRGETSRMSLLVMPYGISKDLLVSYVAKSALTNGPNNYDGGIRIEDLSFDFAVEDGNAFHQTGHNLTNAAIILCQPDEGNEIRNIRISNAGYGIRCLGAGGGAPAAFRDVVCFNCANAGICFEPVPGTPVCGGQVSITGITGDHRWDDSRSNACLVKFVDYTGSALVQDVSAEGIYGGGVIQHQFPAYMYFYDIGILTLKTCMFNQGNSYGNFDGPHNFLLLKSAGWRTTAVTMENVQLFATTNLIRDELTGRNVSAPDSSALGLHQAVVRLPLEYEAYNSGGTKPDGVTQDKFSRLVVGGQAIYSFVPPTTNAWYRILLPYTGSPFLSTKATVSSLFESSEFSVNVYAWTDPNCVELNVTRTMKNLSPLPCVTKVRAGGYQDSTGNVYPFTDIFVERSIYPGTSGDYNLYQITVACPLYDMPNLSASGGGVFLQNPTTALSSIVPSGCTLLQCVTNSLVR